MIPPRLPVTRSQIERVVKRFYARVRSDPGLFDIFDAHVNDWPAHEKKIVGFWANAILYERDYSGNPMQVHMNAGNVMPAHFECWLGLFDKVLTEELEPEVARGWSALVHRIGQGLRFGLENYARPAGDVPNLRS